MASRDRPVAKAGAAVAYLCFDKKALVAPKTWASIGEQGGWQSANRDIS